jgi:hypothetical protein
VEEEAEGSLMVERTHPETGEKAVARGTQELLADFEALNAVLCQHKQLGLVKIELANGSKQFWNACLECGKRLGSALSHKAISGNVVECNIRQIEKNYENKRKILEFDIVKRHYIKQSDSISSWHADMEKYLRTPEWTRKREAVFKRCNFVCEGCGIEKATEVHHLTYQRAFAEMLFDLVGLCAACHSIIHFDKQNEIRTPRRPVETRCNGCRWFGENQDRGWCTVFDVPAEASLAAESYCNNGKNGYEGLR